MLKCQNELIMETSGPYRGDVGPLGQNHHPLSRRWPLWGSCNLLSVPNKPNTLPPAPENVQLAWVASCPSRSTSHLQGADPHRLGLCQNVLMRASFFFSVQGLVTTLSCLCHPNVHLMGSSAPWRSELIISPCAPILWYLSAGHGPAHQRLRPPGAHQS
jgi:hypothetical protein